MFRPFEEQKAEDKTMDIDMDYIIKNTTSYEEDLIEDLKDPEESREFLEVALDAYEEDGFTEALLLVMQHVAQAQGGIDNLRQLLESVLSDRPSSSRIDNLLSILSGLGLRIAQREREEISV